ncbi:hypothetical protein LX87_02307 [Larkinella arboricola]|uniref:Uncharacterized protein n=1 Tax=Larkinella arboricola TaxID=643671 RepID=A0A327WVN6_LARAB|nr:hypothetical protein [Larkinella arboricola]RAJ97407.1 hypothetical protein LX87_02307 [Larkinella arboricola]
MMLTITAIDRQRQWRRFFCQIDEFETAFDILNGIVRQGDQPISALVTDEGGRIELPTEVFDESPLSAPVRALKQDWELILAQPIREVSKEREPDADWFPRLLALRQTRVEQLQDTLSQMQELLRTTRKEMPNGPYKARLMERYQRLVDRYTHLLAQAQAAYQTVLFRKADV